MLNTVEKIYDIVLESSTKLISAVNSELIRKLIMPDTPTLHYIPLLICKFIISKKRIVRNLKYKVSKRLKHKR